MLCTKKVMFSFILSRTNHFIGWFVVHLVMELIIKMVTDNARDEYSEIAVVAMRDGRVWTDSMNLTAQKQQSLIYETDFINSNDFQALQNIIFNVIENGNQTRLKEDHFIYHSSDYMYIMNTFYNPAMDLNINRLEFMLHCVSYQVLTTKVETNSRRENIRVFGMIIYGLLLTFGFVLTVAKLLTRPFVFMECLAWAIVNHNDKYETGIYNTRKIWTLVLN
jgi:hypothetical protein